MFQSLYIIIKMQGLGWGTRAEASEDDYLALRERIAQAIKDDPRFVDTGKRTVSIDIEGYARPVRKMLVDGKN
jgi:PP-loop superfamily ATP-utilizing enzyme